MGERLPTEGSGCRGRVRREDSDLAGWNRLAPTGVTAYDESNRRFCGRYAQLRCSLRFFPGNLFESEPKKNPVYLQRTPIAGVGETLLDGPNGEALAFKPTDDVDPQRLPLV